MSVRTQIYWPYMFSGIYHELTLYVQYTKNQAVKKWLQFELICEVYLEYIVTIHYVRPYPSLLTLYVHYTKTLAIKKWFPFELMSAVYIVTLYSSPCSNLVQIWMWRKIKCTPPSLALLGIIKHFDETSFSVFGEAHGIPLNTLKLFLAKCFIYFFSPTFDRYIRHNFKMFFHKILLVLSSNVFWAIIHLNWV